MIPRTTTPSSTSSRALQLLLLLQMVGMAQSWWLLSQMASAQLPAAHYFDCGSLPGLSKKQYELCKRNRHAMRAVATGLRDAVSECQIQFASEKWNCSADRGFDSGLLNVASRESAYVYALSAGAVSHAVARACSKGLIPDCGCGDRPRAAADADFIWAGCSDNIRYGNQFSRKFIDTAERQRMDSRARMNLHNNRVGRKLLTQTMKKQCKCHGVSGSCVTKTCWKAVPDLDLFAGVLKRKYEKAQQVTVTPDSNELMVRAPPPVASRTERFIAAQPTATFSAYSSSAKNMNNNEENSVLEPSPIPLIPNYPSVTMPASKSDLVFLEASPDYCELDAGNGVGGTRGRECASDEACHKICCGRGFETRFEWKTEPCHCRFEWCCEVKCQQCERLIERRFCR